MKFVCLIVVDFCNYLLGNHDYKSSLFLLLNWDTEDIHQTVELKKEKKLCYLNFHWVKELGRQKKSSRICQRDYSPQAEQE